MEYLRWIQQNFQGVLFTKSRTMLSVVLAFSADITHTTGNGCELASEQWTPVHVVGFLVQGT